MSQCSQYFGKYPIHSVKKWNFPKYLNFPYLKCIEIITVDLFLHIPKKYNKSGWIYDFKIRLLTKHKVIE